MCERSSGAPAPGGASARPVLTDEMAAQYVAEEGARCPFCREKALDGGSQDAEGAKIIQKISCLACGRSWYDVYHLAGILPADGGDA